MKRKFKSGISLIAVLMFMLAATTASIVVYKWIGSENFASGARLKHSEAYQAAESGVEATQAWLSNKGADVGALVTAYFRDQQRRPIKLTDQTNNVLSMVRPVSDISKQNFDVYLVGVDVGVESPTNTSYRKLKFLSVGRGRDDSEVKLSVIFDVAGLYQTKVPTGKKKGEPPELPLLFASMGEDVHFNAMAYMKNAIINGNFPTASRLPETEKDLVITGDFAVTTGNYKVKVGEVLCIGGQFAPIKDIPVDDINAPAAYFGSTVNLHGRFGDVYCDGEMSVGVAGDGTSNLLAISNSLSLNGNLRFMNGTITVGGDLAMGDNSKIFVSTGPNNSGTHVKKLTVGGNVWMRAEPFVLNETNERQYLKNDNNDKKYFEFGTSAASRFNIANSQNVGEDGEWIKHTQGEIVFRSKGTPGLSVKPNANSSDTVKTHCDSYWDDAEGGCAAKGLEKAVKDPLITATMSTFESHAGGNPKVTYNSAYGGGNSERNCDVVVWSSSSDNEMYRAIEQLNKCFEQARTNKTLYGYGEENGVYKEGFLVVKTTGCPGANPKWTGEVLKGRFVLLQQDYCANYRPALTGKFDGDKESMVLLYFNSQGVGKIQSGDCQGIDKTRFNYFIYSKGDINEIDSQFSGDCPIIGNIFLSDCAEITKWNVTGGTTKETAFLRPNDDLLSSLVSAGVICESGDGQSCANGDIEPTPTPPGGNQDAYTKEDQWLAVSSRLKVSIASKSISRETIAEAGNLAVDPYVLVMPRVVRLRTDDLNSQNPLRRFYTFMYLNNAAIPNQEPEHSCTQLNGNSTLHEDGTQLPDDAFFKCTFDNNNISDFYVAVKGLYDGATIRLSGNPEPIKGNECRSVKVMVTENMDDFFVELDASGVGPGWRIASHQLDPLCNDGAQLITPPPWTINCTSDFTGGDVAVFTVCSDNPAEDIFFDFELLSSNGVNIVEPRSSRISRDIPTIEINRIPYSTGYNNIIPCPETDRGDWITLSCGNTTVTGSVLLGWTCELKANLTASYTITTPLPSACELPPEEMLTLSTNELNEQISIAKESLFSGDVVTKIFFPIDLVLKKVKVRVANSQTVTLQTSDPRVPNVPIVCTGDIGCDVYYGVTYNVTYAGAAVNWSCSDASACDGGYLRSTLPSGIITPTGDVTITLSPLTIGLTSCELKANQQVVVGQSLAADLNNYVFSYDLQGPCGTPTFSYIPSTTSTNTIGENITITMGVSCNENAVTEPNASVQCEGSIAVVDQEMPTINCTWDKNSYHVGNIPVANVTTIDGRTSGGSTTCAIPTVSESNFTGLPEGRVGSGTYPDYTITSDGLGEDDIGKTINITVRTVCTGGTKAGTYEKVCPSRTIAARPLCQVISDFANICPNTNFPNEVKWNQAPNLTPSVSGCYYVTEITPPTNSSAGLKINGNDRNGYNNNPLPSKIDEGYYVYISQNGQYTNSIPHTLGSKPDCVPPPEPELNCSWNPAENPQVGRFLKGGAIEGNSIPVPTLTCSNGASINIANVTFSETPWISAIATDYNITATLASGCGTSSKNANCGSLKVRYAPSINSCNFANETGEAGTSLLASKPAVTLIDQSNICSDDGSIPNGSWTNEIWTYTSPSNGTFNWNTLPSSADYPTIYNIFSVRGTCGNYGLVTTADGYCTGMVTVTEPTIKDVLLSGGTFKILPTGKINLICGESGNISCYADPAANINIGCGQIQSWMSPSNGHFKTCNNGQTFSCEVPEGEIIYCKLP